MRSRDGRPLDGGRGRSGLGLPPLRKAAELFDEGGFEREGLAGYKADMALQHAMQSAHTSLESALVRILEILDEERPTGEKWHADLVRRAARPLATPGRSRPAILTPDVANDVDESRRFRHRATHNYDDFDPVQAVPSVEAARRLATGLKPCIAAFRTKIDPPATPPQDPNTVGDDEDASPEDAANTVRP